MDENSRTLTMITPHPDQLMLKGFTHEISNFVTSNTLLLMSLMENEVSLCHKNAEYLGHLFDLIEPHLPSDKREQALDYCQKIEKNEALIDHVLGILSRSSERTAEIARLASEYSRLGRMNVAVEAVQLQDALAAVLQKHQTGLTAQQVVVVVLGAAPSPLLAHPPHLQAIFDKLLLNACQAFAEVHDARARVLEITLTEEADRQTVCLRDNANGISKDHLREIFEPFYTTHPKTALGLGLSFVAKLLHLYHGAIDVASEPGQGATFTLTFPIPAKTD
jgi:histidine kinase